MTAAAMDPFNERNLDINGGSRGLEKYTTAGSTRLEVHRVQVVAAVLREQKRQANWTRKNPLIIAKAASRISNECQELACIQGFNDEMEAYAGNGTHAHNDVVSLPKPGLFSGFAKQVRAISDLAFLERQQTSRSNKVR